MRKLSRCSPVGIIKTYGSTWIRNIGNLTGQNFSEDAFVYGHKIIIVDTSEWKFYLLENPFAMNFYKIDLTN